jgi:hypothetical protein
MMKNFSDWVNEAKKGTNDSLSPTATSSPIRGANQDQSGANVKNDLADYTISDSETIDNWELNSEASRKKAVKGLMKLNARHGAEHMPHEKIKEETDPGFKLDEISPELVGKVNKARTVGGKPSKTDVAKKTLATAVNKAWVKSKAGEVKETVIAGVGKTRIKPVNMAQKTSGTKEPNAPGNVGSLQSAANKRVAQLDQASQQEKERSSKAREVETAKRQREKAARDTERNKQQPKQTTEEFELDEARGRPKKVTGEESINIIMQLRKVITLRGQEPVTFSNGTRVKLNPSAAHRLLSMYDNLKTSGEKHAFSTRIHKSPESLRDVMAGKKKVVKPKISLAGRITGNQNGNHS